MKMYSTNGRKKSDKETASTIKTFKTKLICDDCDFVVENTSAVFGETAHCTACGSSNVRFIYK